MPLICGAANALWAASCAADLFRFRRATRRVREEQARILRRILTENCGTEFGRRHGFAAIAGAREYQDRVPLLTCNEYSPWIARIADGWQQVLTREPVLLLQPTGGSSGATKLIPYTRSLHREYQRGIRPWIADLFGHRPGLMAGRAYWSLSPASANRRTPAGVPVGFDDDAEYLGAWQRRLIGAVMAVPPELRFEGDMDRFRYRTLLSLVRAVDLRLVSVWNPTFFSLLVEPLAACGDALARDLGDARRAALLRDALRARTAAERHAILWPRLMTISCWADGHAAGPAASLAALFPQASVQPKGLIATEGFVSFPMHGHEGSCLAVRSHFFEFAAVDSDGRVSDARPLLAHELDSGQRYSVILSTGGGLYRYHLQDMINVHGHVHECPLIRFIGRQAHVSDWFGEKLTEAFVGSVLRDAFAAVTIAPRFAMLACDTALPRPAYVLYVEADVPDETLRAAAQHVDAGLRRAFHYDYARRLGQLDPTRVFRAEHATSSYLEAAVRQGRRAGDVKPLALDRNSGWTQLFVGRFIGSQQCEPAVQS